MLSCHTLWFLVVTVIILPDHQSLAKPVAQSLPETNPEAKVANLTKLRLISKDVIPDTVENDKKKVIRVSPLDLPSLKEDPNIRNMDSSLYKIQSRKPDTDKRKYINIRRPTPQKQTQSHIATLSDTPLIKGLSLLPNPEKMLKLKHQPKKKNLNFLYNQENAAGNVLSKSMRVHVAPGPYPIYYVVAKTNGRFGKYPLKSFDSPQAFTKYLQKNKLQEPSAFKTYAEEV